MPEKTDFQLGNGKIFRHVLLLYREVILEKLNLVFVCQTKGIFGPNGRLHFTDVGFSEVEHTDPRLTDSSTDCVGKLPVEKRFLKIQFGTVFAAGDFQLPL